MSIITVNAGGSISAAITSAVSGDIIEVQAGFTFDISSPLVLKNHGSSSNPITIRSQNHASLPSGRVAPADAANMPKLRATSTNGLLTDASGGSYWILDGLEITDNATANASDNTFLNLRSGGKILITRCYGHPKESNPTWTRAYARFIWYEGTVGVTLEKSYASGFLGYTSDGSTLHASACLLSIGGKNVTISNNFLSAWYATLFTGGGDFGAPTQTATFSGSPSMSSATFSNTTGLAVDQVIRIDWLGAGTKSGSTFTRTSGSALTNSDVVYGGGPGGGGGVGTSFITEGYTLQLQSISGNVWTFFSGLSNLADGSHNWEAYQAVKITSINGSTVGFTPYGQTPLTRAPETANCRASWWPSSGDDDNAAHWTIQQNTFWIDPEFADHQQTTGGQLPKGIWEFKHMKDLLVNGNRFTGYPSGLFFPLYSNGGTTPWSTHQDITISNNLMEFDNYPAGFGVPLDFSVSDPYHSATIGKNITVSNNLIINQQEFIKGKAGDNIQVYHNTVINGLAGFSYNAILAYGADNSTEGTTGWTFRDNIASYHANGAICFNVGNGLSDCWPSGTWSKNVIVDTSGSGFSSSVWGAGSVLTPIPSAYSSVGFTNQAGGNYRLSGSSAYKGAGTGGTDPGIDQDVLEVALGSSSPVEATTSDVRLFIEVR